MLVIIPSGGNNKPPFARMLPNSLPNDKIFSFTKFKALADDELSVTKVMSYGFDMVENIVEKGENAGYQHFLLFPQCFQKSFSLQVIKGWDCVIKS